MQVSGRPNEGWMTLVPILVLIGIVMLAMGGPVSFMNFVSAWFVDFVDWGRRFIRSF